MKGYNSLFVLHSMNSGELIGFVNLLLKHVELSFQRLAPLAGLLNLLFELKERGCIFLNRIGSLETQEFLDKQFICLLQDIVVQLLTLALGMAARILLQHWLRLWCWQWREQVQWDELNLVVQTECVLIAGVLEPPAAQTPAALDCWDSGQMHRSSGLQSVHVHLPR